MTHPSDREVILLAIADVRGDLAVFKAEVHDDFCEVKTDVAEIKVEAKATNGRLRSVELWRHGLLAVARAHAWVRPAAIAFLSGAGVAVLSWALYSAIQ